MPSIIHIMLCVRKGNFDSRSWLLIVNIDLPFETSNHLVKWCLLFSIATYGVCVNMTVGSVVFIYFVCCTLYVESICKHFRSQFRSINKNIVRVQKTIRFHKKLIAKNKPSGTDESYIMKGIRIKLNSLVLFHCKIIE